VGGVGGGGGGGGGAGFSTGGVGGGVGAVFVDFFAQLEAPSSIARPRARASGRAILAFMRFLRDR
jgi:hypothetical protein